MSGRRSAAGAAPAAKKIPRACSDVFRLWSAVALSLVLAIVFQLVVMAAESIGLRQPPSDERAALELDFGAQLVGWNAFAVSYLALGIRAFAGCDRAELVRRITGSPLPTSPIKRYLLAGGSGPTWAIGISILAFGTIVTAAYERGGSTYLLVGLIAVAIATSWMTITFAFALHYARRDIEHPGLDFGADAEPVLSDYGYFAMACSSTFGTTDTAVTTTAMRRTVSLHSVIALFLNTVVIAVVLSIIVG